MTASSTTIEENYLILQLVEGSHAAFERLYTLHSNQLLYRLIKATKDPDQAGEILQQTFIKVWENRVKIHVDKPFAAFIHVVAKNLLIDHYRKIARVSKAGLDYQQDHSELSNQTEEQVIFKETSNLLQRAIDQLPDQRRKAYTLCKMQGKSHKEAAEIMNISPRTLHNHLGKANESIRRFLQSSEEINGIAFSMLLALLLF